MSIFHIHWRRPTADVMWRPASRVWLRRWTCRCGSNRWVHDHLGELSPPNDEDTVTFTKVDEFPPHAS